jgi:hypothetical protein
MVILGFYGGSLDLSNYEIFHHKILKSCTFKKSIILIVIITFKIKKTPQKNNFFLEKGQPEKIEIGITCCGKWTKVIHNNDNCSLF